MFTKEERSSFKYWFAHWCAFQMTALNLKCWKFKYLFHDIEKPWLRLFMSYTKVQQFHRKHNAHHLQFKHQNRIDWEAMVIDWECSRFTKEAAPLTARETMMMKIRKDNSLKHILLTNMLPILDKLKI
jgi:hypothetical protein